MSGGHRGDEGLPRVVIRESQAELERILREGQFLLLKHPVSAQAAFQALVEEGRRFAATPVGERWRRRLVGSELIRRGQRLWESSLLTMLEETPPRLMPSLLLDAILSGIMNEDLSALAKRIAWWDTDDTGIDPSSPK